MVLGDTYSQPDAPDPVLDAQTVISAARRHAPHAGGLLLVDESGGEARAYHLEGDVVMKTQRPHRLRPRTSLTKEAVFLRTLERDADFPVPRVLGYGHVHGIEYLCLSRMPGTPMLQAELTPAQRAAALQALGAVLRRIHEIDQSALDDSGLVPGDATGADLRTRFADAFQRLHDALDHDDAKHHGLDVAAVATAALDSTPTDVPPVALHSNPGPEHAFVDPTTGHFTGLIDFGDAYRSHPALDLRPWPDEDSHHLMTGYTSQAPVPDTFTDVLRTGLLLLALTRAARGSRTLQATAETVERLLA